MRFSRIWFHFCSSTLLCPQDKRLQDGTILLNCLSNLSIKLEGGRCGYHRKAWKGSQTSWNDANSKFSPCFS